MDESDALKAVAVRAVETADSARSVWSEADRAWASRAAAEVVGANASPEAFVARRAALAVERLGTRESALPSALRALAWRPWIGTAVVALAFVLGFALDQVDAAQRVNILAPPVLGLLAWNVAVYALLAIGFVVRYGDAAPSRGLRGAIARFGTGTAKPRDGTLRTAIVAFADDWARRAAPLYGMRASRILHLAAALLATGVLAGLYLRGLAFEYLATWESTFLDAANVRTIASWLYAPGAWATGIAVPPVDEIAAIRAPAGENAARWLHLIAATVAVVVIGPRLTLAFLAGAFERYRATHLPLGFDEPYFQRLLRGYRGGPARVRVIPYSTTPAASSMAGLEAIVARSFGGSAALFVASPVAYGAEVELPHDATLAATTLVVLFNATATPERETHGAFLAALAARRAEVETLFALVDESAWNARFGSAPSRPAERRAAWQQLCDDARVPAVFVDLAGPDLAAADAALDTAIGDRNA
ncbi:MAG: DUF2868 domain-containing protein [Betaproteobacteria bacterium]